jgi:hypothetical protein
MRAISKRLQRLEKRFALVAETGPPEDSAAAKILARRLARGVPPPPPESPDKFRGMCLSQILNFDRNERRRLAKLEGTAPLPAPVDPADDGPVPPSEPAAVTAYVPLRI